LVGVLNIFKYSGIWKEGFCIEFNVLNLNNVGKCIYYLNIYFVNLAEKALKIKREIIGKLKQVLINEKIKAVKGKTKYILSFAKLLF
jgi:hypothetical protein